MQTIEENEQKKLDDKVNEDEKIAEEQQMPEKTEFEKGDLFYDEDGIKAPDLPDQCKVLDEDNWATANENAEKDRSVSYMDEDELLLNRHFEPIDWDNVSSLVESEK